MEIDELKKLFEDYKAETEAKLDELSTENERLRGHTRRLLADVKKAKSRKTEDLDDEDDTPPKQPDDKTAKEIADLRRQLEAEKAEKAAEKEKRNKKEIDIALKEAVAAVKVDPRFSSAVEAIFKANHKLEVVDDVVHVDGKPLAEAVKAWAASDVGKVYIAAPASGGSGIQPGGKKPNNGGDNTGDLRRSTMSKAQKGAYIGEHGLEAYNNLPA